MIDWDRNLFAARPVFADLHRLLDPGRFCDWPPIDQLDALVGEWAAAVGTDAPRLVTQDSGRQVSALGYELRIAERGELLTRSSSWHDFFNACMWALYPAARRALNALHVGDTAAPHHSGPRSPLRDAVTLIDECGVILATSHRCLEALHRRHRWLDLFWHCRAEWGRSIRPLIIGHGLYEQCLNPYVGLTAKAYYVAVPESWFEMSLARRYRYVDALLAERLAEEGAAMTTARLLPLPLLGVPGMDERSEDRAFYLNEEYFRPLPRGRP